MFIFTPKSVIYWCDLNVNLKAVLNTVKKKKLNKYLKPGKILKKSKIILVNLYYSNKFI